MKFCHLILIFSNFILFTTQYQTNFNVNQFQYPSQSSFSSQIAQKIKEMKFDQINPSPIIINGGNLAPLHIYHQPMWLPSIVRNSVDEYKALEDLEKVNQKIDEEIKKNNETLFQQNIIIGDNIEKQQLVTHHIENKVNSEFEIKNNFPNFKEQQKFLGVETPTCIEKKEGNVKIREKDTLEKDIPFMTGILSKDRFSYYLDSSDESTIQGSILLKQIQTPISIINNFNNCFLLKTEHINQECTICVENENVLNDWINSITQNIVNCN